MKNPSVKGLHMGQTFKPPDFPYPIVRTASGTLYAKMPDGSMRNLEKLMKKGGDASEKIKRT